MHMIDKEAVGDQCQFRGGDVHAVSPCGPQEVPDQIAMFDRVGSTAYCIFGYTWAPMENLQAAREMLEAIDARMKAEGKSYRMGGR